MRLAILSFLLLFAATAISADTSKVIIAGAFNTPEHAQQRVDKLKMYLSYEPDVYALQKAGYFTYEVRRSGAYYLCVLHHFRDFGEVLTVIDSIRKIYPDVYIKNNMNFTQPYDPAAAEVPPALMQSPETQPLSDDQGSVIPVAEESVVVEQDVQPLPEAKPFTAEKTTHPLPEGTVSPLSLFLIAAALLGGTALLLVFIRRRRQLKEPLLMIPDTVDFEPDEYEVHPSKPAEREVPETSEMPRADDDEVSESAGKTLTSDAVEPKPSKNAQEERSEPEEAGRTEHREDMATETADAETESEEAPDLPKPGPLL